MKASIRNVSFGALVMAVTLVGCGGDESPAGDMSAFLDMGANVDMNGSTGCTTITTWPNDVTYASLVPDPFDGYDAEVALYGDKPGTGSLVDSLAIELYNQTGATPSYPKTVTLSASTTYNDCDECVLAYIGQNYDTKDYGTRYLATGGSITISKADRSLNGGTATVSGSKIHLVEWQFDQNNDKAVPKGKCIDVNTFNFTADFDAVGGDGGTDM